MDRDGLPVSDIIRSKIEFNIKRGPDEENLLLFIYEHLKAISEEQYNLFYNTEYIRDIEESTPIAQRVIINRYLSTQLLIFRRYYQFNVTNLLMYLVNDVKIDIWKSYLREHIFPFLKKYNKEILEIYR